MEGRRARNLYVWPGVHGGDFHQSDQFVLRGFAASESAPRPLSVFRPANPGALVRYLGIRQSGSVDLRQLPTFGTAGAISAHDRRNLGEELHTHGTLEVRCAG